MSGADTVLSFDLGPAIEQVFQNAEHEALRTIAQRDMLVRPHPEGAKDAILLGLALREIERLENRRRLVPPALWPDAGWNIFLRIFVAEQEKRQFQITDNVLEWPIGEETALRQVAGLIASGLVARTSGSALTEGALIITDYGRSTLNSALRIAI